MGKAGSGGGQRRRDRVVLRTSTRAALERNLAHVVLREDVGEHADGVCRWMQQSMENLEEVISAGDAGAWERCGRRRASYEELGGVAGCLEAKNSVGTPARTGWRRGLWSANEDSRRCTGAHARAEVVEVERKQAFGVVPGNREARRGASAGTKK
jgi:hypothetical protein